MLDNLTLYTVLRLHLIIVIPTVGGKFILLMTKSQVNLYPNTINSMESCYVILWAEPVRFSCNIRKWKTLDLFIVLRSK